VSLSSVLDPRTNLTSALTTGYDWGRIQQRQPPPTPPKEVSTRAFVAGVTEGLSHQIIPDLTGTLGAGVGYSRRERSGTPRETEFLPTGNVGVVYGRVLGRGNLRTSADIRFAPVLDRTALEYDWRYMTSVGVGWQGSKLSLSASWHAALSATPSRSGGTRSFDGGLGVGYLLATGLSLTGGVRAAYQQFAGQTTLRPTQVAFVALSYGTSFTLF
jgi:hypothetical protein